MQSTLAGGDFKTFYIKWPVQVQFIYADMPLVAGSLCYINIVYVVNLFLKDWLCISSYKLSVLSKKKKNVSSKKCCHFFM